MGITVKVPELGESVDSVEVVGVLVEVGDTVANDQSLIEVETDKAAVEVPSTAAGTVAEIHVAVGDSLAEGDPIVTLEGEGGGSTEESGESSEDDGDADDGEPSSETQETDDSPTAADTQAETSSGDAGHEPEEPRTEEASPGREEPGAQRDDARGAPPPPRATEAKGPRTLVPAAPTVRRFAREVGADITEVRGTGPNGRISIDDVKLHVKASLTRAAPAAAGAPTAASLPDLEAYGPIRREPMSKVRQLTAEAMARAAATVPQVTNHELADITELEALRKRYKRRVEAAGGTLTVTAILVKVLASALRKFPQLNAAIDMAEREIVFRDSIHVGVAVDTERGLLVPVLRDADRKNITDIAVELGDLAARARDRKLQPDELQGATFTISNLGGIGGTAFTPIVNWPQVAILGVSRGRIEPAWIEDEWRPRLMLPLSLSYDHRLVDGADAARFLRWLADALESPLLLALEG